MKECDILRRVKTYTDLSYIFLAGSEPPNPQDLRLWEPTQIDPPSMTSC